jgi:hypothetical protein
MPRLSRNPYCSSGRESFPNGRTRGQPIGRGDTARVPAKRSAGRSENNKRRSVTFLACGLGTPRSKRRRIAYPSVHGEPFMLDPANRTIDPCEENRRRIEPCAIGNNSCGNFSCGDRTLDHDHAHQKAPSSACRLTRVVISAACDACLT